MNQPLPAYPAYKPAGLPWLEQVPAHWEAVKFRNLFSLANARNDDGEEREMLSLSAYRGIEKKKYNHEHLKRTSNESASYQVVEPNQLVINPMWVIFGAIGVSKLKGIVSPAYRAYNINPNLNTTYTDFLLRSYWYVKEYNRYVRGLTTYDRSIRKQDFSEIVLPVPPLSEQQRIVAFLEGKTRQIARLLRNKRRLIQLLTEQKQALIHRAVTQGLDPAVGRKDSGVAWLGEVPAHWEVVAISRIAKVGNGSTPSRVTPEYWHGGSYPWLNSSHANRDFIDSADQFVTPKALAECHLPKVPSGSVLIAITGQGKTRGMAALLGIEATINQHVAYITPNRKVKPEYLHFILTAAYSTLRSISEDAGSTKGALTCSDLKRFKITFPSIEEQSHVMQTVHEETLLIDQTIDRTQREIELIQEYRTRLIADVVTGRVDVRQLAVAEAAGEEAELLLDELEETEEEEIMEETLETDGFA